MPVGDDELDELYKEVILDHYSSPRNKGTLAQPSVVSEGNNPVCGDEIRLYVDIQDGELRDIKFEGRGCSISQSSASMLTEMIKGKGLPQAEALIAAFRNAMYGQDVMEAEEWGDLEALQGVRKFPVRVKCATLAWNTLQEAIEAYNPNRP